MDCGRRRKRGGGLEAVPVGGESFLARYVLYVHTYWVQYSNACNADSPSDINFSLSLTINNHTIMVVFFGSYCLLANLCQDQLHPEDVLRSFSRLIGSTW